jgi:hypothetical protein
MKVKLLVIDLEVPAPVKRWALRLGITLGGLALGGVALAGPPLHTWSSGDTLQASDINGNFSALQTEITAMSTALKPANVGMVPIAGAQMYNPTAGQPPIFQAGTAHGTTDSNGVLQVTFPQAFPNGVLTVTATNGDYGAQPGAGIGIASANAGTVTNTGFNVQTSMPGALRVNYIAIGW